jgi:deoxyribodipyrimidine photo-lyase
MPLHVVFCLTDKFLGATLRHFKFMLDGLEEVSNECKDLNINFHLLKGKHNEEIPKFVKDFEIGCLVCDFSPLRIHREWVDKIKSKLPATIPFVQVDAHNIVPVWTASDKQEYGARTIRNKINSKLDEFLTKFPPVIKHPHKAEKSFQSESINWKSVLDYVKADPTIDKVDWIEPGYKNACGVLHSFIHKRLKLYETKRNDPTVDALSNLSPYFHFGQIAVQRAIIEVSKHKSKSAQAVDAFREEAIVRRELSDNFCYYNKNYDNLNGLHDWAKKTLNDHRKDKREYIYTKKELENSKTHDDLWNAAQIQMVKEGKMHGFLRMYWAKKILEWTSSPEEALEIGIYLNDKYNLDGRDPNGYVGVMWSVGGLHDQGWAERAVFGKIRFMNYQGCKRKFDINKFIIKYGGVVHKKK